MLNHSFIKSITDKYNLNENEGFAIFNINGKFIYVSNENMCKFNAPMDTIKHEITIALQCLQFYEVLLEYVYCEMSYDEENCKFIFKLDDLEICISVEASCI